MLEISIALVILGMLAVGVNGAFKALTTHGMHTQARAAVETARLAVLSYVLKENRLPCPDTTGSGWASDSNGQCSRSSGLLPYATLGLASGAASTTAYGRLAYGGLRISNSTDLFNPDFQAGHVASTYQPTGRAALISALRLAARTPFSSSALYLAAAEPQNTAPCADAPLSNPAFVVIAAATTTAGGSLPHFSSAHEQLSRGNALCAVAASAPSHAHQNSDAVATVSTAEMLGWLTANTH